MPQPVLEIDPELCQQEPHPALGVELQDDRSLVLKSDQMPLFGNG